MTSKKADKNYYEILEVSKNASEAVIRAAYKTLIQRYHPDKNINDEEMSNITANITRAYNTLSNPDYRKKYDNELNQKNSYNMVTEKSERPNKSINIDNKSKSDTDNFILKILYFAGVIILITAIMFIYSRQLEIKKANDHTKWLADETFKRMNQRINDNNLKTQEETENTKKLDYKI